MFLLYCLLTNKHIGGLYIDGSIILDGDKIHLFFLYVTYIYIIIHDATGL